MRVKLAASRFDRTPCNDAYSGALSFMGQLALFDDTKRDSEAGERRIISTSADSVVPARRVVAAAGLKFIIGHGSPDTYRGEVVRVGYVAHEATDLVHVQTLGQLCRNQPGTLSWAAKAWIKNASDDGDSSDLTPQHNFHFASAEPVQQGSILSVGVAHHIVRQSRVGPAGTLIALSDQLPEPVVDTAQMRSGSWDPRTETVSGFLLQVRVLRARWQSLYEYRSGAAPKFGSADLQVIIAKSDLTAKPGQLMKLSDGSWQVDSVVDGADVWICRAVRHA